MLPLVGWDDNIAGLILANLWGKEDMHQYVEVVIGLGSIMTFA